MKERKKSPPRRTRKTKIILPAVAVMVVIAFLLLMVIPSSLFKRNTSDNDAEGITHITTPEFRKDGTLLFLTNHGTDTVTIDIEVVERQAEISRGLMYRPHMDEYAGMLFIFPEEEVRSFWMKNTYIPLDILFLNSEKEILTIQEHTQPLSSEPVPSYTPAKYVIEVNAGFTAKHKIKEGDRVDF